MTLTVRLTTSQHMALLDLLGEAVRRVAAGEGTEVYIDCTNNIETTPADLLNAVIQSPLGAVERIARVAHEVNRAYCQALGDTSQPAWEDAPDWQKNSAIGSVNNVLEDPAMTPERQHQLWLAHKEHDGWTYGPVKDPSAKQHPCFVSYGQLPLEQRAKDYLACAVVRALASAQ